eukprot:GHVN01092164.1.p1 GENE.GHVN01092164.1~~GHVN01092164.1.p1  ORF type:complete len:596 (+),score=106.94 GHVN01092164.1:775-2562(+)
MQLGEKFFCFFLFFGDHVVNTYVFHQIDSPLLFLSPHSPIPCKWVTPHRSTAHGTLGRQESSQAYSPSSDEPFLRRAVQLALMGLSKTRPNPAVGCVVVRPLEAHLHRGVGNIHVDYGPHEIIGEGWHPGAGYPHAEVYALKQALAKDLHIGESTSMSLAELGNFKSLTTAYVSLEPCTHYGRTPPCAEALIRAGVHRVVVASRDANPLAQGGVEILRGAGVKVSVAPPQSAARQVAESINRAFFYRVRAHLPYGSMRTLTESELNESQQTSSVDDLYSSPLSEKLMKAEESVTGNETVTLNRLWANMVVEEHNLVDHLFIVIPVDEYMKLRRCAQKKGIDFVNHDIMSDASHVSTTDSNSPSAVSDQPFHSLTDSVYVKQIASLINFTLKYPNRRLTFVLLNCTSPELSFKWPPTSPHDDGVSQAVEILNRVTEFSQSLNTSNSLYAAQLPNFDDSTPDQGCEVTHIHIPAKEFTPTINLVIHSPGDKQLTPYITHKSLLSHHNSVSLSGFGATFITNSTHNSSIVNYSPVSSGGSVEVGVGSLTSLMNHLICRHAEDSLFSMFIFLNPSNHSHQDCAEIIRQLTSLTKGHLQV